MPQFSDFSSGGSGGFGLPIQTYPTQDIVILRPDERVYLEGTCSTETKSIEWSFDSTNWSNPTPKVDNSSDLDCRDGLFTLEIEPINSLYDFARFGDTFSIWVRARTSGTSADYAKFRIIYLDSPAINPDHSEVVVERTEITLNDNLAVTLQGKDGSGTNMQTGGAQVSFYLASGDGQGYFSQILDLGNGKYRAYFTPTKPGSVVIGATVNNLVVKTPLPTVVIQQQ